MKRQGTAWLLVLLLISGISSCGKKDGTGPSSGGVTNEEVNNWIVDEMRNIYYWNTSIPANSNLNFRDAPLTFFEGILHSDDRFSWMEKADDLEGGLDGISTTVGLGVGLIRLSSSSDRVVMAIRYALEGSPADLAGIQRGDFITRINGREMTVGNFQEVMDPYYGASSFTVEVAKLVGNTITSTGILTLQPVENFQEKAVHHESVISVPSGKKVGYVFYNRFLNNQIDELQQVFGRLKQEGVDELVLDLRYNGGGGILVSGVLAGMVYQNFDENAIFVRYKFNSNYADDDYTYHRLFGGTSNNAVDQDEAAQMVAAIKSNNLNLSKIYVLATEASASASELIINNLRPFMSESNVIHIGTTTMGKNEGSITITDNRNPRRIDWGLQPIIVKLANSGGHGDYPHGLSPSHEIDEWDYLPWVPLGSTDDPLLGKALELIDPSLQAIRRQSMSIRAAATRALGAEPIVFEDKANPAVPVHIGDLDQLHFK